MWNVVWLSLVPLLPFLFRFLGPIYLVGALALGALFMRDALRLWRDAFPVVEGCTAIMPPPPRKSNVRVKAAGSLSDRPRKNDPPPLSLPVSQRPLSTSCSSISILTKSLGKIEDNGHGKDVILTCERNQRFPRLCLNTGRIDHGQLSGLKPLCGDEM